ncbi:MAG: hypothetical protein J6A68_03780, partial [Oscillospiraceae bacterium]|nr:hypothetical protein [Oscillospiraceae bacterium]
MNRSTWGNIGVFLFLGIFGVFFAFPIVYSVCTAFKPMNEILIFPPRIFVRNPSLENFIELGQVATDFWVPLSRYIFNSAVISVVATLGHLLLAGMAAYPLAKHPFPGSKFLNQVMVMSLLFTSSVTYIPQYIVMAKMGLIDTPWALILPALQSSLGVYLMRSFILTIPNAMLEAAAGEHEIIYDKAAIGHADVIIGDLGPADLAEARNLKWFHLVWAGADRYRASDFPAGAKFTNGSGAYGVMIAEHMMACMLAMVRQLRHYDEAQQSHRWDRTWSEDTLEGKTVLILGAGDIGTQLAKRLRGFDCHVTGVRRTAGDLPYFDEVHTTEHLDDLLPETDIVACALPGTAATKGLLDKTRLLAMKSNALLLNCGRGSLIVTKDLEDVLAMGHLGGVAL